MTTYRDPDDPERLARLPAHAARIRAERVAARLTQLQVAQRLGVGKQTITAIESGRQNPSAERVARYLAAIRELRTSQEKGRAR